MSGPWTWTTVWDELWEWVGAGWRREKGKNWTDNYNKITIKFVKIIIIVSC